MKPILLFLIFLISRCTSFKECDKKYASTFKEVISKESRFDSLLLVTVIDKLCDSLENSDVLIIAKVDDQTDQAYGLLYSYKSDTYISFCRVQGSKDISIGNSCKRDYLITVLEKIKIDFNNEARQLKEKYEALSIHDAGFLELTFIGYKSRTLKTHIFPYVSQSILDETIHN